MHDNVRTTKVNSKRKTAKKLTDLLRKYSIGINKIEREEIYDDYLRKKLGILKK